VLFIKVYRLFIGYFAENVKPKKYSRRMPASICNTVMKNADTSQVRAGLHAPGYSRYSANCFCIGTSRERTGKIVDKTLIAAGIEAVQRGGAVLRDSFGTVQTITHKGKLDLVTDTDRRCEEIMTEFLISEFPRHGILAEESPERPGCSAQRWILDPLDGTTNFAHGYPFFCISLAYEQDGRVCWGAVFDPLRDELFSAVHAGGTRLNGLPVRVSTVAALDQALLCTGFPYDVHDSSDNNLNHFCNFSRVARAIRRDGAAALDLCYVAAGRFDGFWEMKLKPWDVAAGCLAVVEAGGKVSTFQGTPHDMLHGDIVASGVGIHADMLAVLSRE
jgi:myo-inositol-1(or 4)-monophosphatase